MKIITWNVNSIKVRQGYLVKLLEEWSPDVVMLQELKVTNDAFPAISGYEQCCHGQKTYNGVATLAKQNAEVVAKALPGYDYDEARYLEIVVGDLIIINVYVPNGQEIGTAKFQQKIQFLERLAVRLATINTQKVIVGGDFNVAVDSIDTFVADNTLVCYAPEVRGIIRSIINNGYYDPFRALNRNLCKFSWWDYRSRGYERNMGMRLDFFLVSPAIMTQCSQCTIIEEYRKMPSPSDHAPVMMEIEDIVE